MKICSVGVELFHTDRQTEYRQKDSIRMLIVAFHNFVKSA
jgi:hypothetical protein